MTRLVQNKKINILNWYFIVDNDVTFVYSTAGGSFVPNSDANYNVWLQTNVAANVADNNELLQMILRYPGSEKLNVFALCSLNKARELQITALRKACYSASCTNLTMTLQSGLPLDVPFNVTYMGKYNSLINLNSGNVKGMNFTIVNGTQGLLNIPFTATDWTNFIAAYNAKVAAFNTNQNTLNTLITAVNAATNVDAVQAVVWS